MVEGVAVVSGRRTNSLLQLGVRADPRTAGGKLAGQNTRRGVAAGRPGGAGAAGPLGRGRSNRRGRGRHGASPEFQRHGRAGARRRGQWRGAGAPRHHGVAPAGARAARFRGQRLARIQNAADRDSGICRNASQRRAGRQGQSKALRRNYPRARAAPGAAHRRSAEAFANRSGPAGTRNCARSAWRRS